jgi:hypothetical protein
MKKINQFRQNDKYTTIGHVKKEKIKEASEKLVKIKVILDKGARESILKRCLSEQN